MRSMLTFLCCVILISCGKPSEPPSLESKQQSLPMVQHTKLRTWRPDKNPAGYGADLLVTQSVTKNQLIALIKQLSQGHDPVVIRIFTSREAYDAEKNEQYGDIYAKGYILFYVKNGTGQGAYRGFNEIRWMQEKGKFADKFGAKTKL